MFGNPTDSLLFDWDDDFINNSAVRADNYCEFRLVESSRDARPNQTGRYRGPIDVTLAPDFSSFMQICRQQQQEPETDN